MLRQVSLMRSRLLASSMGTTGNRSGVLVGSIPRCAAILPPRRAITTDASILTNGAREMPFISLWNASPSTNGINARNSFVQVLDIRQTAQELTGSIVDIFRNAVWQMSSTLKKRKAKINKHKLRKRRKLARRKTK